MVIAVSIGGLTQIVPLFFQDVTNKPVEGMKPRTALNWKAATSTSPTAASAATRR
jgi:cbb3-type cytochrome oxidase cytochrome c subunit